jgi:hypothetical protein
VVDEAYFKLKQWSHILLSPLSRAEKPETLSSLKLSMDDAVYIIQRLHETFTISNYEQQQRLLTMLPLTWGRDHISNWFGITQNQARHSIAVRSNTGIVSYTEDHRGNKPLDDEVKLMVHNFYICDEISRETSYKKPVIRPPPS